MSQNFLIRARVSRPGRLAAAIQLLGIIGGLGLLASNVALAESPQPKANEPTREMPRGQSSGTANQQTLDTYRDKHGTVRTEDGRTVRSEDGDRNNRGQPDDSPEHSHEGGPTDPGSDPGATESPRP
ncbi:hypothetical protein ACQCLI_09540 [Pseudomonas nitroreducens]|uniref:hypothetical protein n=1 Tax=Pseudomonas TaxID=286 RepID=UPI0012FE072F|nr:hypothetical protein [Pseudomonas nitroreducens]